MIRTFHVTRYRGPWRYDEVPGAWTFRAFDKAIGNAAAGESDARVATHLCGLGWMVDCRLRGVEGRRLIGVGKIYMMRGGGLNGSGCFLLRPGVVGGKIFQSEYNGGVLYPGQKFRES